MESVNVAVGQYSAHTIPVDVYTEGRNEGEEVERLCCQVSLDVELWLNNQLNSELAACDITYHSLTDYDLQLAEVPVHHSQHTHSLSFSHCVFWLQVCGDSGSVILILVALLEAGSLLLVHFSFTPLLTLTLLSSLSGLMIQDLTLFN